MASCPQLLPSTRSFYRFTLDSYRRAHTAVPTTISPNFPSRPRQCLTRLAPPPARHAASRRAPRGSRVFSPSHTTFSSVLACSLPPPPQHLTASVGCRQLGCCRRTRNFQQDGRSLVSCFFSCLCCRTLLDPPAGTIAAASATAGHPSLKMAPRPPCPPCPPCPLSLQAKSAVGPLVARELVFSDRT